jgi:hypothetical protein
MFRQLQFPLFPQDLKPPAPLPDFSHYNPYASAANLRPIIDGHSAALAAVNNAAMVNGGSIQSSVSSAGGNDGQNMGGGGSHLKRPKAEPRGNNGGGGIGSGMGGGGLFPSGSLISSNPYPSAPARSNSEEWIWPSLIPRLPHAFRQN